MKKRELKQIRDIAHRLPKVMEQHMSGHENGQPNLYTVEVNHERRLRHAYERIGMDGIKSYLDSIHKLQKETHEKAFGNTPAGQTVPISDQVDHVGDNNLLNDESKNTQSIE